MDSRLLLTSQIFCRFVFLLLAKILKGQGNCFYHALKVWRYNNERDTHIPFFKFFFNIFKVLMQKLSGDLSSFSSWAGAAFLNTLIRQNRQNGGVNLNPGPPSVNLTSPPGSPQLCRWTPPKYLITVNTIYFLLDGENKRGQV